MKIKGVHAAPALVLIVALLICASNFLNIADISKDVSPYLTVMALEIASLGLPCVVFCILKEKGYESRLGLRIMRLRHLPVSAYALLLLISGGIAISIGLYWLFPDAFTSSAISGIGKTLNTEDTFYVALSIGILPALLEEFLFRGIVNAEYSVYGSGIAVVFSSLLFASIHFSFVRFPIYFFAGVVLALLFGATRSLAATSVVHIMYNVFSLYFEKYIYKIAAKNSGGLTLLICIVIGLLLLSSIFFFGSCERLYLSYGRDNVKSPLRIKKSVGDVSPVFQALLSPTFLAYAVFFFAAAYFL